MNKKLLAVAVAGALAAPLGAYAQSTVTITGTFKGSFESYQYKNSAKANASGKGVTDDSSQIVFRVIEDLGGGMSAIAQLDVRFKPDDSAGAAGPPSNVGQGNTYAGLQNKAWGQIVMGRHDLHYFNTASDMATLGSLRSNPVSLLAYAGGGGTAIASASRTQNVIRYLSPNWGGFTMIVAYSSSPLGPDADIGSGVRKGSAWNLNPIMQGANYQVDYSYWTSKPDAATGSLATGNQRGDRLTGSYKFGGFKVGLAFDKSRIKSSTTGATLSSRKVWSFPASYSWGNHSVHAHYTKAGNDSATAVNDSAKMIAASYAYKLSARTSAAVTFVRIANSEGAFYQPFTAGSLGSVGVGGAAAIAPGEDPRLWSLTLRHVF